MPVAPIGSMRVMARNRFVVFGSDMDGVGIVDWPGWETFSERTE